MKWPFDFGLNIEGNKQMTRGSSTIIVGVQGSKEGGSGRRGEMGSFRLSSAHLAGKHDYQT
jgi:hypothetical protein